MVSSTIKTTEENGLFNATLFVRVCSPRWYSIVHKSTTAPEHLPRCSPWSRTNSSNSRDREPVHFTQLHSRIRTTTSFRREEETALCSGSQKTGKIWSRKTRNMASEARWSTMKKRLGFVGEHFGGWSRTSNREKTCRFLENAAEDQNSPPSSSRRSHLSCAFKIKHCEKQGRQSSKTTWRLSGLAMNPCQSFPSQLCRDTSTTRR